MCVSDDIRRAEWAFYGVVGDMCLYVKPDSNVFTKLRNECDILCVQVYK